MLSLLLPSVSVSSPVPLVASVLVSSEFVTRVLEAKRGCHLFDDDDVEKVERICVVL